MIKICIQNLGMYNEGTLRFKWLTLPATEEEIDEALTAIRISHMSADGYDLEYCDDFGCPYEEYHIPDWECDIDGLDYNEWATIEYYNEIAKKLEELDEYHQHWVSAYMNTTSCSFEEALDCYEDNSCWYEGQTFDEVAEESADERLSCMIPHSIGYGCDEHTKEALEWLQQYFDYDAYKRDLKISGNFFETEHGTIETY